MAGLTEKVYSDCWIRGPYVIQEGKQKGRKYMEYERDGKRHTKAYPRFLMEIHLNRYLTSDETIHHIDRDFNNNDISNLQILDSQTHRIKDALRLVPQIIACPVCGIKFELRGKRLADALYKQRYGSRGPYCSNSCSGKGSHKPDLKAEDLESGRDYDYLENF